MRDFRRLQEDPPQGVTGAPEEDDIMKWNAVIFGYAWVVQLYSFSYMVRSDPMIPRGREVPSSSRCNLLKITPTNPHKSNSSPRCSIPMVSARCLISSDFANIMPSLCQWSDLLGYSTKPMVSHLRYCCHSHLDPISFDRSQSQLTRQCGSCKVVSGKPARV